MEWNRIHKRPQDYVGANLPDYEAFTLKNGRVFSPLFSAFGPEPIKARMTIGYARALVTTEAFYRRKIEPWRKASSGPATVLLTECPANPPQGTVDLAAALTQTAEDIAFRQNLPKTRRGKIMRRLLKARELGLPEGDISTLESEER